MMMSVLKQQRFALATVYLGAEYVIVKVTFRENEKRGLVAAFCDRPRIGRSSEGWTWFNLSKILFLQYRLKRENGGAVAAFLLGEVEAPVGDVDQVLFAEVVSRRN